MNRPVANCFKEIFGVLLNKIKRNKVKKERYLMRQDSAIYTFSINLSFSSIGQDKSKLQKEIKCLSLLEYNWIASSMEW